MGRSNMLLNSCRVPESETSVGNKIEANNAFAQPWAKRRARTEKVRSDKIDHAPVLDQVVLEGIACQDHAASGLDVLQSVRRAGMTVLDPMALVTNHHIGTRPGQSFLYAWGTNLFSDILLCWTSFAPPPPHLQHL